MEMMRSRIEEIPVRAIQGNTVLAISVGSRELEQCEKAIRQYGLINQVAVRRSGQGKSVLENHQATLGWLDEAKSPAVLMVTTNLEFSKWPAFLGNDPAMSTALVDRLIHRRKS